MLLPLIIIIQLMILLHYNIYKSNVINRVLSPALTLHAIFINAEKLLIVENCWKFMWSIQTIKTIQTLQTSWTCFAINLDRPSIIEITNILKVDQKNNYKIYLWSRYGWSWTVLGYRRRRRERPIHVSELFRSKNDYCNRDKEDYD